MRRPRWVVPVLPKGELEVLLEAAIDLCKKGKIVVQIMVMFQCLLSFYLIFLICLLIIRLIFY